MTKLPVLYSYAKVSSFRKIGSCTSFAGPPDEKKIGALPPVKRNAKINVSNKMARALNFF